MRTRSRKNPGTYFGNIGSGNGNNNGIGNVRGSGSPVISIGNIYQPVQEMPASQVRTYEKTGKVVEHEKPVQPDAGMNSTSPAKYIIAAQESEEKNEIGYEPGKEPFYISVDDMIRAIDEYQKALREEKQGLGGYLLEIMKRSSEIQEGYYSVDEMISDIDAYQKSLECAKAAETGKDVFAELYELFEDEGVCSESMPIETGLDARSQAQDTGAGLADNAHIDEVIKAVNEMDYLPECGEIATLFAGEENIKKRIDNVCDNADALVDKAKNASTAMDNVMTDNYMERVDKNLEKARKSGFV